MLLKSRLLNFEMSFWRLQFLPNYEQKQVVLRYQSSKVEFLCSFFGRNVSLKKSFRLWLTFNSSIHLHHQESEKLFNKDKFKLINQDRQIHNLGWKKILSCQNQKNDATRTEFGFIVHHNAVMWCRIWHS